MERNNNGASLLLLLINPTVLISALIVFVIGILVMGFISLALFTGNNIERNSNFVPIACQQEDMDMATFKAQFTNAGVFSNMSGDFIDVAEEFNIDPVLLSAMAFHETGRGTSRMVRERNNPGGLYDSSRSQFFTYSTLSEGLNAMASNLSRNYIEQGLFTVALIGSKYAPIGVENDPNGLNAHWVPNVSKLVAEFGGLTMNCELVGFASGFVAPIEGTMNITSQYGTRVHPTTGVTHSHRGIDFGCTRGQSILAVADAQVVDAKAHSSWGNYILLGHGDKYTLYAHMTETYVERGEQVTQGQAIGSCGSTGDSTGPHLHLEVHINKPYGTLIDPLPYFQGSGN